MYHKGTDVIFLIENLMVIFSCENYANMFLIFFHELQLLETSIVLYKI